MAVGVHRELLAEGVGLPAVARAVRDDRRPFVLAGAWLEGGEVIAGGAPVRELADDEDPFAALDDLPDTGPGDAAFGGGWVGLLGFELARRLERLPAFAAGRGAVAPGHRLAFYDHVLRLDAGGRCWFEALEIEGRAADIEARAAELRARLAAPGGARPWNLGAMDVAAPGLGGHERAVASVIERIAAGEIFQANLCVRLEGRLTGSPLDAWLTLIDAAPAPYGAFLGWTGGSVLSASPELFLRRRGRAVTTAPMKGTRRRVDTDDDAAHELAASPKDRAENVMIVDLMRNDLGRVCSYGSVIAGPPQVEGHPGVWQLVGHVEGTLRDDVADAAVLRACFPPGSVVGAPKVQALKVIAAEEAAARGAHCGAIGFVSPVAGLAFSVAIRSLEVQGEATALGVGGGIVADSVPADEVAECLDKAAPLLRALRSSVTPGPAPGTAGYAPPLLLGPTSSRPDPAHGIFETVLVRDGVPMALEDHLTRLRTSVRALWDGRVDVDALLPAVHQVAEAGPHALRIVVTPPTGDRVATVAIEPRPAPARDPDDAIALAPVQLPGGLGAHKWRDRRVLARPDGRTPLICDRGAEVLEASWANVWIREGDTVITPPADGRLRPGVRRAAVLRDPSTLGAARAIEERLGLERLGHADEVLLTSALRWARAVVIDDAG